MDKTVSALILAGGYSTRMGVDKGLMEFKGKPMIQHSITVLKPIANEIILSSNNVEYKQFGFDVVSDNKVGQGPLAGLIASLEHSKSESNIVLSCDVPLITTSIIEKLLSNSKEFDVTVANSENQIHPLIGVYKKSCLGSLKKQFDNGERSVQNAIKTLNLSIVNFTTNLDQFANFNSNKDLLKHGY
jgi:molybdopterin-guanine dinucleotide biosynthesis protein A